MRCPLVRRSRLLSGFCPSTRTFAPRFLQTSPHDDSPCASLALHLHQVGQGTFTPKLLSMPSTQLSRWRGGEGRWVSREVRGVLTSWYQKGGFHDPTASAPAGRTPAS